MLGLTKNRFQGLGNGKVHGNYYSAEHFRRASIKIHSPNLLPAATSNNLDRYCHLATYESSCMSCVPCGGPHVEDYSILGSILGSPCSGALPNRLLGLGL